MQKAASYLSPLHIVVPGRMVPLYLDPIKKFLSIYSSSLRLELSVLASVSVMVHYGGLLPLGVAD